MTTQFDNIYHGSNPSVGKLRMSAGGLGWKTSDTDGIVTVSKDDMKSAQWLRVARGFQLRLDLTGERAREGRFRESFEGFEREDFDKVAKLVKDYYDLHLEQREMSLKGWNWGKANIDAHDVTFQVSSRPSFSLPLGHIANSNIAGGKEVSLEFLNPDQQAPDANTGVATNGSSSKRRANKGDQLVEMRFFIPGMVEGSDAGSGDENEPSSKAQAFHDMIKSKADIGAVTGDCILVFSEVLVLTPRGRYDIDIYPNFLRLRGKTYDYKVLHTSINRLFLLPKPDDIHVQFVIGLDPPIRQGQTRYPYLVLQFVREEEMDAELNLDEETIQTKYEGKLKKRYEEPTFKIVSNVFRVLTGRKLITPAAFESTTRQSCVKCNVKANEGLLYPLEKGLIWVAKQPVYVPYSDVSEVVFSRVGGAAGGAVSASRTFELAVSTKIGADHVFGAIPKEEHKTLQNYLRSVGVRTKNELQEGAEGLAAAMMSDESDEEGGGGVALDDDDEESDDEDFRDSGSDDGGSATSDSEASDAEMAEAGASGEDSEVEMVDAPKKKKNNSERPKKRART